LGEQDGDGRGADSAWDLGDESCILHGSVTADRIEIAQRCLERYALRPPGWLTRIGAAGSGVNLTSCEEY
jgi:hypothetical protein